MPDILEAMRLAYKTTDEVLKARDEPSGMILLLMNIIHSVGCTAVSAIIQNKNNKTTLYCANVGDARIVLK
jgi:serine/threonine protein phosphatase PrpC